MPDAAAATPAIPDPTLENQGTSLTRGPLIS